MRTTFTIQGESFDSLATEAEASRWAIIDRAFPDAADVQLSLAKASIWLGEIISVLEEPSDKVVRCVVRLATFFAAGDLTPVPAQASVISNAGMQVSPRLLGEQDQDAAHRYGFPDVESYRLVKDLLGEEGKSQVNRLLTRSNSFQEVTSL